MIKSKALEINLARTQVDVAVDPRFDSLREVMARYHGLLVGVTNFLKEVSHPYKNWHFIVGGARGYALDYFHLMRSHPSGDDAARSLLEIFFDALSADTAPTVKVDAADNLILFLQRMVKPGQGRQERFDAVVTWAMERIGALPDELFVLFVRSYYPLKRLAEALAGHPGSGDAAAAGRLMARLLASGLDYWLSQTDPLQQFVKETGQAAPTAALERIFAPIVHSTLAAARRRVAELAAADPAARDVLTALCALPDHNDILQNYRTIPQQLLEAGGDAAGRQWKVLFLFQVMNLEGLNLIHEDVLRDINRTLHWLITHEGTRKATRLVQKTFSILGKCAKSYPATALNCLLNMGKGIFETADAELTETFLEAVIELGFQSPQIRGVGNDWQIIGNPAHLQNIRTWMELVELSPKRARRLLSNLIIHLAVSGVFIRDTDLFGRDITRLLNSDIGPVYNLVKQLARLFPVYFNDIGAEGELRDISTRIDEVCHRRDPLIHFLRKQSHVEGSNRILKLMDAAIRFWATKDKSGLVPFLPPDIFAQIETEGPHIDGVHRIVRHLSEAGLDLPWALLEQESGRLGALVEQAAEGVSGVDRQRVMLFSEFFKQLNQKYNLDSQNLRRHVEQLPPDRLPQLDLLKKALDEPELKDRIVALLDYLELLKSIMVSPQTFEIREDVYKKRHFTVDIPSMYGSYRELKFDAMGLTLRIEALLNVLFEELINGIDLSFITKATCHQINDRLRLFDRALKVDGIASAELERQLDLLGHSLETRGFSFTQYLDIFKGFAQAVRNIINDYFNNIHGEHLTRILLQLPFEELLEKFRPGDCGLAVDAEKVCHRNSEIFFRDRLATSLGLQQLDLFLSRIFNTLFDQSTKLPKDKLRLLLSYDPHRAFAALHSQNPLADSIIYLGNKGLNLVKLKQFGLPVPPGFIITTEVFRCREIIEGFPPADANFKDQLAHNIRMVEQLAGKRFGDPQNPLLFSVRSGSSISQPGMMDTFLNVGMNQAIAEGMAARSGNPWFAWDSYRRFLQHYGMGFGLRRDDFDTIIDGFKKKLGMQFKKEFTGAHMKEIALSYRLRILDEGFEVPDDPMAQLHNTIRSVMDSWESDKAKAYRQIMAISDDWGTAITVQSMVFGNLSQRSGSGVIFTHNPRWPSENLSLWGDFTIENQGEDVVSGLVKTLPISLKQQEIEMRETDVTLETHFPDIFRTMSAWAHELIFQRGWTPQEMEFTFESPQVRDLHLLQTRDMAIRERKRVLAFDPEQKKEQVVLGHGIGVSAGAMSGRLVFSLQDVDHWRKAEPRTMLILVRGDTVPDDIKEIFAADGLLTARGGVTSHAAVVAHRLGKTCVVGCASLVCDERNQVVYFGSYRLCSGDFISIDGREGSVYLGNLKIKEAVAGHLAAECA